MNTQPERPATPQTQEIIGRSDEKEAVRSAITGDETCALYFIGEAGIGKTRQLREVDQWYTAQQEGHTEIEQSFEWLGLVDLYHSDLHTPSVVERQIIDRIDPDFERNRDQSPFKEYLDKRDLFEQRRRQGLTREKERVELTQTFVNDFNSWAADRRVVIAFDTLELIVYEKDKVLKACEGEAGSADVKGWLLQVLPRLQNSVILLANRPHRQLEAEFQERFTSMQVCYQKFELERLNEEETLAYLDDIFNQRSDVKAAFEGADPEILKYTAGVPILISLLIDLVAFGNVAALDKLRELPGPENRKKVRELLVNEFKGITPPIWNTLRCLAVARKGLTPTLFQRLMVTENWELERCRKEMERLRGAAFVKTRKGSPALFLHDALYEMFDEFESEPLVKPERFLPLIIAYYEERIGVNETTLEDKRSQLRELELRASTGIDVPDDLDAQRHTFVSQLAELTRERQRLQVELVFYKLWRDPLEGFEIYAQLYNEALKAHEFGFEARLHDEVLRYLRSSLYQHSQRAQERLPKTRFDRHCGLRWLKFHLARAGSEGYARTVRVAERMLEATEPPLGGPEAKTDLLYQGELRLWGAEARIHLGQEQKAEEWLQEALQLLESTKVDRAYLKWRRSRLIGRAHNDLGYIYRWAQHYRDSVIEYRRAIKPFREADIRDEMADTLNNLAYVYSIQGDITRAKALAEDARQLRERLGRAYPRALSYSTTGKIHIAANEPEEALVWCERARVLFADMQAARGLGLAYIGLGRGYRKLGDKGKRGQYSFGHAREAFEAAVTWLEKAQGIFGGDAPAVTEPYRLWETLNELGSTYTDWASLLAWHGLREQAQAKYELSVQYQKQAAQVAQANGFELQLLDSYDDLAQVYADWDKLAKAQGYLGRVFDSIPEEYKLIEGVGFADLTYPVDGYWLLLGKIYLQRGIWAHKEAQQTEINEKEKALLDKSARHFAIATAYFQQFSSAPVYVDVTSRALYWRFRSLKLQRLERLRREVQNVARQYRVDLGRLLDMLDDTLGASTKSL